MTNEHIQVAAGEHIFREGASGDTLYVITAGTVRIYEGDLQDAVELEELGPGEFFGEMAIVQKAPRCASAQAVEACTLLPYTLGDIETLVVDRPGIAVRIIEILSQRLAKTTHSLFAAEQALRHR